VRPYTNRRRGRERVAYPPALAPLLAPILDRTQGIPIFQEQAMALSMALAGYTAAEADELRRTMGNQRKAARLAAALERLRGRMVGRGIDEGTAAQLVDDLRGFANYGFPESHAWSFALIAYATAYLKAHHPAEFYAAILNAWPLGFYAPSTLVHDARRHGVEVRPPCLRDGRAECTVEGGDRPTFRVGWRFARGIGGRTLERLTSAQAAGPFASVEDAVRRAALTRAEAAALARAGTLAAWEPDRRRAAWAALRAVSDTLPLAPVRDDGEAAGGAAFAPRALRPGELVTMDYVATGISTVGHPMARWRRRLTRLGVIDSRALAECRGGERVLVAGLVSVRQQPTTARGTVFLLLEDEHGMLNVIVPAPLVAPNREAVRHATFLAVYGRAERDGPLVNVIATAFKPFDHAQGGQRLVHPAHSFH
jgi:error-prone DNA polymerase